jgi:hypothetical protein
MAIKYFLIALTFCCIQKSNSQNLGGLSTYNFLKLAPAPQLSALGGTVVSIFNNDASLSYSNPALLQTNQDKNLYANINFMYGGIKQMYVNYTKHTPKRNINWNASINFINYGKVAQTDASGNTLGNFSPNDFNAQLSFSKRYLKKWQYGATAKLVGSNYAPYQSYAVVIDFGVTYTDSSQLLKAGAVFKNIGFQIKKYANGSSEALPFDFQLGVSKKLERAPLQFIFTATNMYQFDIRYADTIFENELNGTVKKGKFTLDKLFRHFILATQIYPSKNMELTISYNYLRRRELGLFNIGSGITGFSFGVGFLFNAYQFRFAKAFYQNTKAYNQIGLGINFNKLHL